MLNVWFIDDEPDSSREVAGRISSFASATKTNIRVHQTTATPHRTPPIAAGDVVVVFPKTVQSTLPTDGSWLPTDCAVLPVVAQVSDAAALPAYLAQYNVVARSNFDETNFTDVLADEILSQALLLRRERSVFISYRRSETSAFARQLSSELQARGYVVFHDARSIAPGVKFADEIAYRLNDVDLVILLTTANTALSAWVMKEITFAHNAKIGILALDCDRTGISANEVRQLLDDSEVLDVGRNITDGSPALSAAEMEVVLARLLDLRVTNIVRRMANVMPVAIELFERSGAPVVSGSELGQLHVGTAPVPDLVQVLPFRPTPEILFDLHCSTAAQVIVAHPENAPNDPRALALKWVCLPVEQKVRLLDASKLWI